MFVTSFLVDFIVISTPHSWLLEILCILLISETKLTTVLLSLSCMSGRNSLHERQFVGITSHRTPYLSDKPKSFQLEVTHILFTINILGSCVSDLSCSFQSGHLQPYQRASIKQFESVSRIEASLNSYNPGQSTVLSRHKMSQNYYYPPFPSSGAAQGAYYQSTTSAGPATALSATARGYSQEQENQEPQKV